MSVPAAGVPHGRLPGAGVNYGYWSGSSSHALLAGRREGRCQWVRLQCSHGP